MRSDLSTQIVYYEHPERKLSPIGTRALKLYKDACARPVGSRGKGEVSEGRRVGNSRQRKTSGERRYVCTNVRRRNPIYRMRTEDADFRCTNDAKSNSSSYKEQFLTLVMEICSQRSAGNSKPQVEAKKVYGWQELSKHCWTEIDEKLNVDEEAFQQVLKGKKRPRSMNALSI